MLNKKVIESIAICAFAAIMTVTAVTNSGISGNKSEDQMLANTSLETNEYAGATAAIKGYQVSALDGDFSVEEELNAMVASSFDDMLTDEEKEWLNYLMPNVEESLNVRVAADDESEVTGKLYKGAVATVTEAGDEWSLISSGNVVGYVKNEYCLFGLDALNYAYEQCGQVAEVNTDSLRIRESCDADSKVVGSVDAGKKLSVDRNAEVADGWVAVIYKDNTRYVSADYVTVSLNVGQGITIEEEEAAIAAAKAAEEKERQKAEAAASSGSGRTAETTQGESIAASADDLTLLAALIYCEAGGECYEAQLAVGAVVVNRLEAGYADSIYGVIYQRGQFGPAATGKLERRLAKGASSTSYAAAQEALSGVDNTGGALSFRDGSNRDGVVYGNMVFF